MKRNFFINSVFIFTLICNLSAQRLDVTRYVDPYIGSGGHGHVFIGANVPFGAVQVGPSNFFKGWDWCSGYNYQDSVITGFPQLHLSGTGIGDLGDVLIMPYMGDVKLQKGIETKRFSGYSSKFSHKSESVKPGYYKVKLDDYNIQVELTASERVAFHKYTFPQGEKARIIIDLKEGINDKTVDTYIQLVDKYTIKGYRTSEGWAKKQKVFFAIKSSVAINDFSIYDDANPISGKEGKGASIKGLISFAKSPGIVSLKVGISPVNADNALDNIKSEIPDWNFEKIYTQADEKWNKELAKIVVETKNEREKRIFYTAMYHSLIHPSLFNDSNGDYMGSDWTVYKKPGFDNYTVFSLWDTYRAVHPLFTIIDPKRTADFVNTMIAIFEQTGKLPIWHLRGYDTGTMVGISSFQVIAEAYLKGCKGFDAEKAFEALKTTAMSDLRGLDYDRDFKSIPSDVMTNRPVAMALEYAIGNASIALMAKKMGKIKDYEYFSKRAENYKLYFDKETGFIRGKMADGSWNKIFDPIKSKKPWATDYAEGNAWQYLWLVPHDVEGLIELQGGEQVFEDKLNTFFSLNSGNDPDVLVDLTGCIGQYAHGNEPSHHIAYLYSYIGKQWKTARLVRDIMTKFYHDQHEGIVGNEDCGQMSAWYIFSSLGFYPVFPASGQYVLGSPLFDKATVNLDNGKKFIVEAINNSPENIYIQSVELNGKAYNFSFISHNDIMDGGIMRIRMGNKPNYDFAKSPSTRPQTNSKSVSLSKPFVHPGMAQNQEDLDFMKQNILSGKEPWKTAFSNLKKQALQAYVPKPVSFVSEGPYGENSVGGKDFFKSSTAVYTNAIMWYITKDKIYADKAIEILNAWSYKLQSFDANNAKLNVGLYGYYFLNAAEILKYSNSGWSEKDMEQFKKMTLTVFYPTIENFFTEANGNWDASMISTMLCIGVYTENTKIFNRAVDRFYWGVGNSGITKYIYPGGQCQEATRDWDHVQLGVGEFAKAAQTALTQGLDFYSVAQDRLAYAFEQNSKMMLGNDLDIFGVLSKRGLEKYKDIYESIYNYYTNVRGIEMPFTKEVILRHTRYQFPIGFLSGVRKFSIPLKEKLDVLPSVDFLRSTKTGALSQPSKDISIDCILVKVGESLQTVIDKNKGKNATILLDKGVHILDTTLKIYSGITLAGYGKESILFLRPGLQLVTITNAENEIHDVTIRDILIEGAVSTAENNDPNHDRRTRSYMSASSREGIVIRSEQAGQIKNLIFENVTIQNFTKNGVLIVGGSYIKINCCNLSDNGSSVVPGAGFHHNLHLSHVTDCKITNSRFDTSPWGSGIEISFAKNVEISGNEMCRNKMSGIWCYDSERINISNNLAEGNDMDGISIDTMLSGCENVTLNNNCLQNNGRYGIMTKGVSLLKNSENKMLLNQYGSSIETKPLPDQLHPDYTNYPIQDWEKSFSEFGFGVYKKQNFTLPYRLYKPANVDITEKLPLVILMHGAGERGIDNRYQFYRMKGFPFWEKYPCIVLAPQCPTRENTQSNSDCVWVDTPFGASASTMKETPTKPMQLTISLLDSISSLPQVDKNRIYITGLSMGGFATWELIQRFPFKFAAAVPVCGGGDPSFASKLVHLPLWAFHGDADNTVLPQRSQEMIKAIKADGGNPLYTEYPGVGHGAWTATYANQKMWDWMFSQKKQ
jgi:predicted alpha-1,2-mannosidase